MVYQEREPWYHKLNNETISIDSTRIGGCWSIYMFQGMAMDEMIRRLHRDLLSERGCEDRMSKKTREEVCALLSDSKGQVDGQDHGYHQEDVFLAVSAAEENGFVDGFKYAFRLFSECMHG